MDQPEQSAGLAALRPEAPPVAEARRAIVEWLIAHAVRPGQRLPPQAELARALHRSATTIQNALGQLATERVVERRRGAGTILLRVPAGRQPAPAADAAPPLPPAIVYRNLPFSAQTRGMAAQVVLTAERTLRERYREAPPLLLRQDDLDTWKDRGGSPLAGLVILQDNDFDARLEALRQRLPGEPPPVVHVLFSLPPDFTLPYVVCIDNFAIGQLAGRTFAEAGYKRLLVAVSGEDLIFEQQRQQGLAHALRQSGTIPVACPARGDGWSERGERAFALWQALPAAERPAAVFCMNDAMAQAFCAHALAAGLRIPQDLSVLGVDNSFEYESPSGISLSTIDPMCHLLGEEAAKLLCRLLSPEAAQCYPGVTRIPPRLVWRQSGPYRR